jgi:hypothetical protein
LSFRASRVKPWVKIVQADVAAGSAEIAITLHPKLTSPVSTMVL